MPYTPDAQPTHRPPDRAVSPVIGVVLMVAITIVLAAIIGAFVLGMAPGSSSVAPIATVAFAEDDGNLTISHEGGDPLDLDDHSLLVDGGSVTPDNFTETLRSGHTRTVEVEESDEVEVILRHDPTGDIVARQVVDFG